MPSNITLPSGQSSSDQAIQLLFQNNFYPLMQQTKSKLVNSGVAFYLPTNGYSVNQSRIGRTELTEVTGRNPNKVYKDLALDNRQLTRRRFTGTFMLDKKTDINEYIADPTSAIYANLNAAKERLIDRIIYSSGIGSVLIGQPNSALSSLSAANDGVVTVNATAGLTYAMIQRITENFINNDFELDDIRGAVFAISGTDHTQLMSEDKFINNDYLNQQNVANGAIRQTGLYDLAVFSGSKTGGIVAPNPILNESSTTRTCAVMTKESVGLSMEVESLRYEANSPTKANSSEITLVISIGAMRMEGSKVQLVTTTF